MSISPKRLQTLATFVVAFAVATPAWSQSLDEDFTFVNEEDPASVFVGGTDSAVISDWNSGISGEKAAAQTEGNARATFSASGSTTAGVGGSGAGVLEVLGLNFNLLDENFGSITETGGGAFLLGDGVTTDLSGFTLNWDDGLLKEGAFAEMLGGAILIGNVSAQGTGGGGLGGTAGGEIVVDDVNVGAGQWNAGLFFDINPFPGGAAFLNAGFEEGTPGFGAQAWTSYGNVLTANDIARSGVQHAKLFGAFPGNSGIFQSLTAEPGQEWQLTAWAHQGVLDTGAPDNLIGTSNSIVMKIEFFDASGTLIEPDGFAEITILDGNSPVDTWLDSSLQLTAPAGTVEVRPVVEFVQPGVENGSGFIDDVRFRVISGPPSVDLGQVLLTADIQGSSGMIPCPTDLNGDGVTDAGDLAILLGAWGPNPGNPADLNGDNEVNATDLAQLLGAWGPCPMALGQLGDYQLRLEDVDSNRLIFSGTANGTYQPVGGVLSSALEADADGVPTPGIFNVNSGSYRVTVAFDNESGNDWGSGGTLRADNLLLPNTDPSGSDWQASLFWDELPNTGVDTSNMSLTADILGSVPGGQIELRVGGIRIVEAGLNEAFTDAAGDNGTDGGAFLDSTTCPATPCFGFSADWDSVITGEGAFGGIFGNATLFDPGISATALLAGGNPGKAAEVRVDSVGFGPGGGWFAGLSWGGQGLASTDLSQVELRADVRGLSVAGGTLGLIELRIEDQQGDRRYFQVPASGGWQNIGGFLDTAMEGPSLGGAGDGVFDLDSPSYSVAIAFFDEANTWGFGGILRVDNVFLTPVDVPVEIGRVRFTEVADGVNFQTVGGLLTAGDTTFGDFDENFSGVQSQQGVTFDPGADIQEWHPDLAFEHACHGTFGNVTVPPGGSATAQACTNCGFDADGAAELIVGGLTFGGGAPGGVGFWACLFWEPVGADLSSGVESLENVILRAKIKGEDGGNGMFGTYFLRIEDEDLTVLTFTLTADGTWQDIGGPLSGATLEQIEFGDNVFNFNQTTYTVTVGFVGDNNGEWGTAGKLTVDDLFLTGTDFGSADQYKVSLSFEDPVGTWGDSGGSLTVDNVLLAPAGGN